MSLITASNAVQTNSIDTIGGVAMTIGDASATSIAIGSSTAGRTPTITIDTLSTANSNADPAIAIGTSSSVKTIKLGISTSSVHCSSLDMKGSALNNITNATGDISIGNLQTDGILNLGTGASRTATGVINIGNTASLNKISIDTASVLNAQSTPAIAIGTSSSKKTISIGNNTAVSNNTVFLGNGEFVTSAGGYEINNGNGTMYIGNKQTSAILNIGTQSTTVRGSGANIKIGTTVGNTCAVDIMNGAGATTVGSVNIANGGLQGTAINIGATTNTGTVNILSGTGSSMNIANGTGARTITIGNTSNVVNVANIQINNAIIGVASGSAMSIGGTSTTVNMTGNLTMGTGKRITLQPTTGYVAPTAGQLGFVYTQPTFLPTGDFTTGTELEYGNISLDAGVYMVSTTGLYTTSGAVIQSVQGYITDGTTTYAKSIPYNQSGNLVATGYTGAINTTAIVALTATKTIAFKLLIYFTAGTVSPNATNFNFNVVKIA